MTARWLHRSLQKRQPSSTSFAYCAVLMAPASVAQMTPMAAKMFRTSSGILIGRLQRCQGGIGAKKADAGANRQTQGDAAQPIRMRCLLGKCRHHFSCYRCTRGLHISSSVPYRPHLQDQLFVLWSLLILDQHIWNGFSSKQNFGCFQLLSTCFCMDQNYIQHYF